MRFFQSPLLMVAILFTISFLLRATTLFLPGFIDENTNILVSTSPQTRIPIDPIELGRPLLRYLYAFCPLLPFDFLLSARLFNIFIASTSTVLLYFNLRKVLNQKAAVLAGVFWCINPFLVLIDRFALQDPFNTFFVLCAFFVFLYRESKFNPLGEKFSLLVFGAFLGVATLNKMSFPVSMPAITLFVIWLLRSYALKRKLFALSLIVFGSLLTLALLGDNLPYFGTNLVGYAHVPTYLNPNRASNFLSIVESLYEIVKVQIYFLREYNSTLVLILFCFIQFYAIQERKPALKWLGYIIVGQIFLNAFVYNSKCYSRYFHTDYLLIASYFAIFVFSLPQTRRVIRLISYLAVGTISTLWIYKDLNVFISHSYDGVRAPSSIPTVDQRQYFSGSVSGDQLDVLISKFKSEEKRQVVFVRNFFSPGAFQLLVTAQQDKNLAAVPLQLPHENLATLICLYKNFHFKSESKLKALEEYPYFQFPREVASSELLVQEEQVFYRQYKDYLYTILSLDLQQPCRESPVVQKIEYIGLALPVYQIIFHATPNQSFLKIEGQIGDVVQANWGKLEFFLNYNKFAELPITEKNKNFSLSVQERMVSGVNIVTVKPKISVFDQIRRKFSASDFEVSFYLDPEK